MTDSPMKKTITRLLTESRPSEASVQIIQVVREETPGATLFLECQLVLKGGIPLAGVLTTTSDEVLRLLSPGKNAENKMVLVDHYFGFDEVLTIAVGRDMPRGIGQPAARNGSPIILGH